MRMVASLYRLSLSGNVTSLRHAPNRPSPKPVRSTRLSHSAGMIWSVSTSLRSSGIAVPVIVRMGSMCLQVLRVDEVAGDGGRGGDGGGYEVRAAAGTLAPFEVAVRCGRSAFAGCQLVGVHGET